MKVGTYFAYWEREWDTDFFPYISKVKSLGFDVLEIAAAGLVSLTDEEARRLNEEAVRCGITLTACIGLPGQYDVSSEKEETRQAGIAYMKKIMDKMAVADIHLIGGIIYAYWPVDYTLPVHKQTVRDISIKSMRELADYAAQKNITLALETVNRYEHFLLNDAQEAVQFVKDVGKDNVKVMLDVYHMNIEEDSFHDAILTAGPYLGHFHIGETNRKVPGKGKIPWQEVASALREIHYDGMVVMEPFVKMGGQVGQDIRVWRDLSGQADEEQMDRDIAESCRFIKNIL